MNTAKIIGSLLDHVTQLREAVTQLQDSAVQVESLAIRESAYAMASRSLIFELAERCGVQPDRLYTLFEQRINHFHDEIVLASGDQDSSLSARLDLRTLDQIPADSGYDPLFL